MKSEVLVSEYAKKKNVSLSNIYQRVKRGTLDSIHKNGKLYIFDEVEDEVKRDCKKDIKRLKSEKKLLQKLLKAKDDEIETLKKSLSTFSFILETKFNKLENVTEAKIEKVKKKKNRSGKKK